jgi:hypothetical protein
MIARYRVLALAAFLDGLATADEERESRDPGDGSTMAI